MNWARVGTDKPRLYEDSITRLGSDEWAVLIHMLIFPLLFHATHSLSGPSQYHLAHAAVLGSLVALFMGLMVRDSVPPAGHRSVRLLEGHCQGYNCTMIVFMMVFVSEVMSECVLGGEGCL